MQERKRIFSGIQPTSVIHIGNYFGAVANWVKLQEDHECIYCVVDLHAMTMPYQASDLFRNTREMMIDLLACGIDPEKSILFVQSMVPEHMELAWILNCVTSYGELSRMTQFKDKADLLKEGDKEALISAGLFTYPILQAADILAYKAEYVPVGKDQEQHLELSRNIAVRFNAQFQPFFPEPKPLFTEVPKLMSLADPGRKMSKSLGPKHYVSLFEEDDVLRRKVRSAVTDSGMAGGEMSPGVSNLLEILKACGKPDVAQQYAAAWQDGSIRYKDLKEEVAETLSVMISALREKRAALAADRQYIKQIERSMAAKARAIASEVLREVRSITGLHEYGRLS